MPPTQIDPQKEDIVYDGPAGRVFLEAEGDTEPRSTAVRPPPIRSLLAMLAGSLILRLAASTMGLMLLFYLEWINQHHFKISHTETGFIVASFFIAELLGAPVFGALSDRYGRKLFIIFGPLFGAVAVQITSMTIVIWLLVITRLLEGLSTASAIPATLGYISEATDGHPKLRARVVGVFEITLVGGVALGAAISGPLWNSFNTPTTVAGLDLISPAFAINGLIYIVSLVIFAWGLSDVRRNAKRQKSKSNSHGKLAHYKEILRSPRVWRFVPAWLAINSIMGMWINHSPRLMTGEGRLEGQMLMGAYGPLRFGIGFGVLAVIFSLGVLAWSFYLGVYRKTSAMMVATGGLFMTILTVYCLNYLDPISASSYYSLLGSLLIGVLVLSGFTPAALTYLADVTEDHTEDRGTIMGLYTVFLGIGQFIGTTTGGFFATWAGINGLLLLSAILGLITVWTLVVLRRHETRAITSKSRVG